MSASEETATLEVIENIYAMALDDDRWATSLDSMAEFFDAVGVSFEIFESISQRPIFMELGTSLSMASKQEYMEYYGKISPRVAFNVGRPTGFISYDNMILTEPEMDKDEFYTDCMGPLGLRYFLASQVFCSPSHQAVFAVHRSPMQGHVDSAAITKIERLLPHLQQAMDLKFRLAAAEIKSRPDLESLEQLNEGCVTVDRTGKTLFVNATAAEIIARHDGIDVVNGVISFSDTIAARRFGRLLEQLVDRGTRDASVQQFPAKRPNGKRPYLIALRSLPQRNFFTPYAEPAAATIFIRDPEEYTTLNTALLQQSYGLTMAEAELAAAFDRGLSLRDIADSRAVSINTVRTQLYALMAKLGVNRQTELTGLLVRYHTPFS